MLENQRRSGEVDCDVTVAAELARTAAGKTASLGSIPGARTFASIYI
jgi:hypothetical protein